MKRQEAIVVKYSTIKMKHVNRIDNIKIHRIYNRSQNLLGDKKLSHIEAGSEVKYKQ